jgi:hypothetical protein
MSIYVDGLKKAVAIARDYYYHAELNRQALQLVESMTSGAGRSRNSVLFKQCDEYAREMLGSSKYSPWLKAYAVFAGTFKEGWIPDNYYGKVVVPRLEGGYGDISDYRSISRRLFQTELLPDLAYSVNGLLYTPALEPIKPSELKKYLFAENERIVYKLDGGLQGKGVFVYDSDSFPDESIAFGNGAFQGYIAQHPFFDAFCSQSVSTIRITTVVDDESNVSCRAAYLRLPRSADTHVKSATAIKVAVNINDGELDERGYLPSWVPITNHPDSGQSFARQIVPNFQECIDMCVALHGKVMLARLIGWDIIVDIKGDIAIMEWNGGHTDIKFSEAVNGPCFADLGWRDLWRTRDKCNLIGILPFRY